MSMELHHTSWPRGLKSGTTGFCTVGMTEGMPERIAQTLEGMGAYQPLFDLGTPNADKNPPSYAHWRVNIDYTYYSVLSRICFAGGDHQKRANKYAHHLVLDSGELSSAGPAWVMMQPGLMAERWSGDPRLITERLQIPDGENPLRVCETWGRLAGDPGWAGVLAAAYVRDPKKPVYVLYDPMKMANPGKDMLALMNEALLLLPEKTRWRVAFNTFFPYIDTLPKGLDCSWRCCAVGSPSAKAAPRQATSKIIIDLSASPGRASEDNRYVQMARTGQLIPEADESAKTSVAVPAGVAATSEVSQFDFEVTGEIPLKPVAPAAKAPRSQSRSRVAPVYNQPKSSGLWPVIAAVSLLLCVALACGCYMLYEKSKTASSEAAEYQAKVKSLTADLDMSRESLAAARKDLGSVEECKAALEKSKADSNRLAADLAAEKADHEATRKKLAAAAVTAPQIAANNPKLDPSATATQNNTTGTPTSQENKRKIHFPELTPVEKLGKYRSQEASGTIAYNVPSGASFSLEPACDLPMDKFILERKNTGDVFSAWTLELIGGPGGTGGDSHRSLGVGKVEDGNVIWSWLSAPIEKQDAILAETAVKYAFMTVYDPKDVNKTVLPRKQISDPEKSCITVGVFESKPIKCLIDQAKPCFVPPDAKGVWNVKGRARDKEAPKPKPGEAIHLVSRNGRAEIVVTLDPSDTGAKPIARWAKGSSPAEVDKAIKDNEEDRVRLEQEVPKAVAAFDKAEKTAQAAKAKLDKESAARGPKVKDAQQQFNDVNPMIKKMEDLVKLEADQNKTIAQLAKERDNNKKQELDKKIKHNDPILDAWHKDTSGWDYNKLCKMRDEAQAVLAELAPFDDAFKKADADRGAKAATKERKEQEQETVTANKSKLLAKKIDTITQSDVIMLVKSTINDATLAELTIRIPKGE